jgi:phospholipid-binding lipoprotein MlaA
MKKASFVRSLSLASALAAAALLTGCAKKAPTPTDPYESYNRPVYYFNMGVDVAVYRNLALAYDFVTPTIVQNRVTSFFNNLGETTTFPNDLFQGKINYALIDMTRFVVNSTIGLGGLFDVASHLGLPTHTNDFGITLASYSDTPTSPYFVIPFLGPSTLRDAFAMPVDAATYPPTYIGSSWLAWGLFGLQLTNERAILLPMDRVIAASFDTYAFVRDAYLQTRNAKIQKAMSEGDYHFDRQAYIKAQATGKLLATPIPPEKAVATNGTSTPEQSLPLDGEGHSPLPPGSQASAATPVLAQKASKSPSNAAKKVPALAEQQSKTVE